MFGGGQNNNMTFSSWWEGLQLGFKSLLIVTLSLAILNILLGSLFLVIFANIMTYTIYQFQIWRLFTSFLVDFSILQVIMFLFIIYQFSVKLVTHFFILVNEILNYVYHHGIFLANAAL